MFSQWYVANTQTKKSFSVCFCSCSFGLFCAFEFEIFDEQEHQQADADDAPKKGHLQAQTQEQAIVHYPIPRRV
jgi:hypothetical protein